MKRVILSSACALILLASSLPSHAESRSLLQLPLAFEPNRGQSDSAVKFISHGLSGVGYTLALTSDSAEFAAGGAGVRMTVAGARKAKVSGLDPLPGKVNYFLGNDPQKWISDAPTYGKVASR